MPNRQIKEKPSYLQGNRTQHALLRRLTQIMLIIYGVVLFINGVLFLAELSKFAGVDIVLYGAFTLGFFLLSFGLFKTAYHLILHELLWVKKGLIIMFWAILPGILAPYVIFHSPLGFLWIIHLGYILLYFIVFLLLLTYNKWTGGL